MKSGEFRLKLLGVGAMNSPLYAPAGLLLSCSGYRIMFDGGPGAEPKCKLNAWLVTDSRGELIRKIRRIAALRGAVPQVAPFLTEALRVEPHPVIHTSHETHGYLIQARKAKVVWAPEFLEFPDWAEGADFMFAEAAGWNRPIRFRGGVGGHQAVLDISAAAERKRIGRLIFSHIGRPTIRAMAEGKRPPFGEFGREGAVYWLSSSGH